MKIEKHNAHGLQLIVSITPMEALTLIRKIVTAALAAEREKINHWFHTDCYFEDDNDVWEPCSFDVVLETGSSEPCVEIEPSPRPPRRVKLKLLKEPDNFGGGQKT